MKNQHILQTILIFIITLVIIPKTLGQDKTIEGKVSLTNPDSAVYNISVLVKGTQKGTTTDSQGRFILKGLEDKEYTLQFSCIGYKTIEKRVKPNDTDVSISLEQDKKEIEGINVYGKQKISPVKDPTAQLTALVGTVQTLQLGEIRNFGAVNILEALKYTVAGNLGEQGRKRRHLYSIRGQSVDYAIDGISLYSFQDAPDALSVNMIDQMEVTRSSNALLLGYSGLNGVINLKTKTFDTYTTIGEVEYGSFNKIHANLTHGGNLNGLKYAFSVTKDQMDGPVNRNGAEDMLNIHGKLQYTFMNKLELTVQHFYMTGMREFAQMQNDEVAVSPQSKAMIWKFDPLKFNVTTAKVKFYASSKATTELQFYRVDSRRDYVNRAYYVSKSKDPENPSKTIQTVTDSIPPYKVTPEPDKVFGVGLFQTLSLVENNYLRIAVVGSKKIVPQTQSNPNGTFSNTDIRSYAATIIDEHTFGKLSANAGVKFLRDYYKRYAPGSANIYIENEWQPLMVNFNAGATYNVTSTFLINFLVTGGQINAPKQSIAIKVNAPGDTSKYITTDENRFNIDLGITKKIRNIGDITLTAFYIDRKDAFKYSGVLYYDDNSVQKEYLTNYNGYTYGIDIIWGSEEYMGFLTANLSASLKKSYAASKIDTTQPQAIFTGSVTARKFGASLTINAKYVDQFYGDRFVDKTKTSADKLWIGDYLNIDISASYALPKTPLTVYGRIINITDKKFATNTPVYPDYGRQFSVGVRATF